tara:strand:+ start:418 stop:666 length:249 start_codon:yes stop_codon:yes gene_type:complete
MTYPYVKNMVKYKSQLILEICNINNNYRVIIKPEYLFDEDYIILYQKYPQKEGDKILGLFELLEKNILDLDTSLRLFKIINE